MDAGKSTHRSYPAAPGVTGGGPSAEHDYALGLALHYYLTGDPDSKAAVVELANWVCAMDDGRKNIFRWLDRGDTGWASATGSLEYQGPGRGAGNSIATLLTAARVTSHHAFVSKAEALIRRCIHPSDDPNRHDLLDPERRWSYTVFVQALGSYLRFKAERNELDGAYAYARDSLLTYARWMRGAEYPYLDKPELLEYPTETWVAQELRKAEVFVTASLYTDGAEREQMKERAEFFFEYAIRTLHTLPTASFTRPLALILSYSGAVPWLRLHPDARAGHTATPPASVHAAPQATFVPQRFRAIRRAKIGMAAGAVTAVLSALMWLLR